MDIQEAKEYFIRNFVAADNYDGAWLRCTDDRKCGNLTGPHSHKYGEEPKADVVNVDYEDEESGGFPMCLRCFAMWTTEGMGDGGEMLTKRTAEEEWTEWERGGTWPLTTPRGTYTVGTWEHFAMNAPGLTDGRTFRQEEGK